MSAIPRSPEEAREFLGKLKDRVDLLFEDVVDLEATAEDHEERIAQFEAENEQLRERVDQVRDGDEITVEWTQLGQREASIDPEIADFSVDRQTEDVVEKAVVYGGSQTVKRQTVTVSIAEWVDLPFPDTQIVDNKENVHDGDTEFKKGDDYQIHNATEDGQPRIKALADGSLSDGQTVSVDAEV